MEFQFKGLPELFRRFPDDAAAREYLEQKRWEGCPTCPYCSSNSWYKLTRPNKYKCKNCRKGYSLKVGTIFENSKIPLNVWFAAMYLLSSHKKGYFIGTDCKAFRGNSKDSVVYAS